MTDGGEFEALWVGSCVVTSSDMDVTDGGEFETL